MKGSDFMVMTMKDYGDMMKDPKRSEAAIKGAQTRKRRESLHASLIHYMLKNRMDTSNSQQKIKAIEKLGDPYTELLNTRWV